MRLTGGVALGSMNEHVLVTWNQLFVMCLVCSVWGADSSLWRYSRYHATSISHPSSNFGIQHASSDYGACLPVVNLSRLAEYKDYGFA